MAKVIHIRPERQNLRIIKLGLNVKDKKFVAASASFSVLKENFCPLSFLLTKVELEKPGCVGRMTLIGNVYFSIIVINIGWGHKNGCTD